MRLAGHAGRRRAQRDCRGGRHLRWWSGLAGKEGDGERQMRQAARAPRAVVAPASAMLPDDSGPSGHHAPLCAVAANRLALAADTPPACASPRNSGGHGVARAIWTPASIGLARAECQSRWPERRMLRERDGVAASQRHQLTPQRSICLARRSSETSSASSIRRDGPAPAHARWRRRWRGCILTGSAVIPWNRGR